jgi:membrane protease YdiL (CAAX protease family)
LNPGVLDFAFVAVLGVVWPLYEHFIGWPVFLRWLREGRRNARVLEYQATLVKEWLLVGVCALLWSRAGRSCASLGLTWPVGWRTWASVAVCLLVVASHVSPVIKVARNPKAKARVRKLLVHVEPFVPHSDLEFGWFVVLSLTAGVCEEVLFRGAFVWALAPTLTWWGAAAVSVIAFGFVHAYQGRKGIVRAAMFGAVMTLVVAGARSLVPAIALHALVDLGSGTVAWLALKDGLPQGAAVETST